MDPGWLGNLHPAALSLPILNRTGKENKMEKFINNGKIRKIIYQLLSMEKPDLTWKKLI